MPNYRLRSEVVYKCKRGVIVVYKSFDFIFFSGSAARWLRSLLQKGRPTVETPAAFVKYLVKRGILDL